MKRVINIIFLTWALCGAIFASGQKVTVSGQVRDQDSGELLNGAVVWDSLSASGSITNTYGFFSLTLTQRPKTLRFSYVGYQTYYLHMDDEALTGALDIRLKRATELDEVIIKADKVPHISGNPLSLQIGEIRNMPTLLGEADVLKAFSFTPGVSTGNEGSAGLYVRGGTPDQNLILLDQVPVYNVMHLGGFFSVFNTASLKSADLYKGAFPARYGGRLSSVIDITMKEGNNQRFAGELGLGLLNQSLTLEGPIVKNKASFIVSGRVSTLGLSTLLTKKRSGNGAGEDYTYKFHDLNAKLNYQLNKTDHVYISFYNGFDRFKYEEWQRTDKKDVSTAVGNNWGNVTGTMRYSKMLSRKLFSRAALIYSQYTSEFTNDFSDSDQGGSPESFYRYTDTKVTDLGAKIQFDYFPTSAIEMRIGIDYTRHLFTPFQTSTNYSHLQPNPGSSAIRAFQTDFFLDADITLTRNLILNAGGRYTVYKVAGRSFHNLEPRLGLGWSFTDQWKLTGSATVMNQYLHLLVNNGYGFAYDAWLPSTALVPPSRARQWSVGLSRKLTRPELEISLEYYQKRMNNMIDYPDGTNFTGLLADAWDNIVAKGGLGRGSGLEMMVQRNEGKLKGRVSYTLAKSELKFDLVNNGQWYPMKYDRRHNFNLSASYALSKKWSLNTTFIYQTGHAVTLPQGALLSQDGSEPRLIYSQRNKGRMPAFHKLDLGVTRSGILWDKYRTTLGLGVYNAYNRANPLYLDFSIKNNTQTGQASMIVKQYSLFPILPFVNYSIHF